MPPEASHEAGAWIEKAERDLLAAERLMEGADPLLDVAVYHCQQAAEKALKGFLAYYDQPIEKTHSLPMLLWQAQDCDAAFACLHEHAEVLTPFATRFRYPGARQQPDAADAVDALARARDVLAVVRSRIQA